ncbi:MAG: 2Fe-2S iron-sulfur cluster-binding protein [Pararhodobacter sp.]
MKATMKATWILPDGREIVAEVPEGRNLMEAALAAGVPGVIGECGGTLSCATCHVHVEGPWAEAAGKPGDFEDAMLDATEAERTQASRLSCQIEMSAALDGIVLRVPRV